MSNYLSSIGNRLYVAQEAQYGVIPAIATSCRVAANEFLVAQKSIASKRWDRTGSRSFIGEPAGSRKETSFHLRTNLSAWSGVGEPSYAPLFQSAMGAAPTPNTGLAVASATATQIQTAAAHGLSLGSGVSFGGEIRFVTAVIDASTFAVNAPFSFTPGAGALLAPCLTFRLANDLPSFSIFDYWQPSSAISRIIPGAGVDTMEISVNGDFHEVSFAGYGKDVIDSLTFTPGTTGLDQFPPEPTLSAFDRSIVPGHLGQAWLGNGAQQCGSVTSASVVLRNHLLPRAVEFGSSLPTALIPGWREVDVEFSLLACDDDLCRSLYSSARTRTVIPAMLQLGQQQGRIMAVYVPQVTPEMPAYTDENTRVRWNFRNCLANGVSNDELYLAFA